MRVTPQGDAVVAGRAAPGAEVTLRDNGAPVGTAKADAQGQFVITPAQPIPPGAGELSLSARSATGEETKGNAPVAVLVPQPTPASPAPAATAVLTSPSAAPRVLQAPPPPAPGPAVTLDAVDYDASGAIRFGGRAPPGHSVRVYVDNAPIGDATADPSGAWGLTPTQKLAEGDHTLRADLMAPGQANVEARVELPFHRAAIPARMAEETRMTVQPGQNLWRIARATYGQGIRYTDIFAANRSQIRDPDLIYPGQVFALPGATPSSAKTSK